MSPEKIRFTKEKETMLMTLFPRAIQSRWEHPILKDPWAEEAVKHIDYDFKIFRGLTGKLVERWGCAIVATRDATFDMLTKRFLADHPDAVVLNLGCGMDSRVYRVDAPETVTWYDVDYPDVIALYRQLYPERPSLNLIGSPLEDLSWLDDVPNDRPALIMAEGVLMYLEEVSVKALLHAVTQHFPEGQVVFDTLSPWIVKHGGKNVGGTGASYRWAIGDPLDMRKIEPRLAFVREYRARDLVGYSQFPVLVRALNHIPGMDRMQVILVFRFDACQN